MAPRIATRTPNGAAGRGHDGTSAAAQRRIRTPIEDRITSLDWDELERQLDDRGFAMTDGMLAPDECAALAELFDGDDHFRSTIDMARYRFGDGRYRYFDHPLPPTIAALRCAFYPRLAAVANRWSERLGGAPDAYPAQHEELIARCRRAGQVRPTPLMLRYGPGDWNALHQDLYGEVFFPFQVLTVLSKPGADFTGGQFVLLEQRPRAQSRAHVLEPEQGAFVIFPTRERPQLGSRGYYRVRLRHGVSTIAKGSRTALGIIFHDSK